MDMRIIVLSTLKAFWGNNRVYRDAREPGLAWYRQVLKADFDILTALKGGDSNSETHATHD